MRDFFFFFFSVSFLPKICNMHVELEFLNPKFLVFLILNDGILVLVA